MKITPAQHAEACNYPGRLDETEVVRQLTNYLKALGVIRKIERLPARWRLEDYPSLKKYTNSVLNELLKRNPKFALAALDALDPAQAGAGLGLLLSARLGVLEGLRGCARFGARRERMWLSLK